MSKKIDERLPRGIGEGALPNHAAIKSPWDKLFSFHDTVHYAARYGAVVGAAGLQALRILIPDYAERSAAMCEKVRSRMYGNFVGPYGGRALDQQNTHPFFKGTFITGLIGDAGDETQLMCGRVNDFGTYRVEKELDWCDWDIVGSELCRATTISLQASGEGMAKDRLQPGSPLEFSMVEARGCGDLHCRIVAECRKKYPMPPRETWDCFGPIATADQIKNTPEDEMITESMFFREECDNAFVNGTCWERGATEIYPQISGPCSSLYIFPLIDTMVQEGKLDEKFTNHVIKCVYEAAGKAAFGEFYAREGLRNWVGAPADVNDGRLMGAHIEMYLQSRRIGYEIEAFNKDEVIYTIHRAGLQAGCPPQLVGAILSLWYGMTKTLVSAQWSLWEDAGEAPPEKLRIRIAKKIDKFC